MTINKPLINLIFLLALYLPLGAKEAVNQPYVTSLGPFYARCIPSDGEGSKGITQIKQIRAEGDELISSFDWYSCHGIEMAWSPIVGKISIMRRTQEEGLLGEAIEFSFYLGSKFLKSYSVNDLIALGVKKRHKLKGCGISGTLDYSIEGSKVVPGTNETYFFVKYDSDKVLIFDIKNGTLSKILDSNGVKTLVPVPTAAK